MPLARKSSKKVCAYRQSDSTSGALLIKKYGTPACQCPNPVERAGDLDAQIAALHTGLTRLLEISERRGTTRTLCHGRTDHLCRSTRGHRSQKIPDGTYKGADVIEDDGFGSGPRRFSYV